MKKKIVISALAVVMFLLFNSLITKGQNNYEDVVYLKNGGIMHGMIIEQVPNVSIKIQTWDRNVFVYKIDEIEKMTKEPVSGHQNMNGTGVSMSNEANAPDNGNCGTSCSKVKQKGVTCIMELTMNRYDFMNKEFSLSTGFRTSVGYLFNPHFSLGGGLGFEANNDAWFFPIFAALRVNFTKTAVTPYISADIGYSFANSKEYESYKGGLMINPSFGVKFAVSPKCALNFSLGYLYQEYQYNYYVDYYNYNYGYYYPYNYSAKDAYKMFNFKIGVTL